MDVKTTFLHWELEETIYMTQPDGFIRKGEENKVCLLKRSLYGLKQSSRMWYKRFDEYMLKIGFSRSKYDSCVYQRNHGVQKSVCLFLYVDDMLIASESLDEVSKVKNQRSMEFEMKDLGPAKKILGMGILRNRKLKELFLQQCTYIEKVLERFSMSKAKPVLTPLAQHFKPSLKQVPEDEDEVAYMEKVPYSSVVGIIMYPMVCSRLDLAYSLSVVSRFMSNPGKQHWEVAKWVLRYLNATTELSLKYGRSDLGEEMVQEIVDSDFAGNMDTRRSLTGYLVKVFGNTVSWKATLQRVVALSKLTRNLLQQQKLSKKPFGSEDLYQNYWFGTN